MAPVGTDPTRDFNKCAMSYVDVTAPVLLNDLDEGITTDAPRTLQLPVRAPLRVLHPVVRGHP